MIFTTSWDDGYALDLQVARILEQYGATGTFYVCPHKQHDRRMVTTKEIRELGMRHEIGAHTMSHPHLTQVSPEKARREIAESKQWVEDSTGNPCTMFCYPYGDTDDKVAGYVKEAGFAGARTVEQFAFSGTQAFALPTSLHIYPYPFRPVANRRVLSPLLHARPHLKRLKIPAYRCGSWSQLAKQVFAYAHGTNQPWFHLWGHSPELEKYILWNELESFLGYVATYEDVVHAPNSALLSS
ncbi:hypothetical protein COU78_01065 [Candidatus Peregrinibacteria bacterium CG10_big_fil_rev_8_21_14_0_10_49_24]|nr:MAG: hypothetical protein COV83_01315 [Candidatus Peregrinibacteria bacterium CG11_big_fil_rev_8_21_14_0_20_49_14]PIR51537.1 MAG: hypothetical protein COU78_01065 [Candidatus Peregrinibacteria bacterium CG10_big_fil_rev_8_21_14_0_10_49_24]PJA67819.1 MAG: hypothetical protein CO157_02275 [Candidatus Peregrinibacteria bacterium CG_4_9_14_3_um_filter_49_12]